MVRELSYCLVDRQNHKENKLTEKRREEVDNRRSEGDWRYGRGISYTPWPKGTSDILDACRLETGVSPQMLTKRLFATEATGHSLVSLVSNTASRLRLVSCIFFDCGPLSSHSGI